MTYTPTIYDWRNSVQPVSQVFRAGGLSVGGGMTLGGASVENPEPGGRAELMMEFDKFATEETNLDASWLASRMLNGNVMRIRLFAPSVQLVSDALLGGSTASGIPWSNGLPWDGGAFWAFEPTADVSAGALKGASSFGINMNTLGQVLKIGHVIGLHLEGYDFAHVITDISYNATNRATVQINPPLRRRVYNTDFVYFRPSMLVTCTNAREVMGNYMYGTTMQFAPMRFVEALV